MRNLQNVETISNQLYETGTKDLSQAVDSGDLAAAVRETAETNEVELLSSIALDSFEANEPTCTITDISGTDADLECGLPSTNLSDESSSPSDKSSSIPSTHPSSSPSDRSMGPSSVPSSSPVITESDSPSSVVSASPSAESGAPSSAPSPLGPSLTPTQCQSDSDCNDGNPCTLDFCSPGSGCVFDALAMDNLPCGDDFNIFTHGDGNCQSGACVGLHYPSAVPSPIPSEHIFRRAEQLAEQGSLFRALSRPELHAVWAAEWCTFGRAEQLAKRKCKAIALVYPFCIIDFCVADLIFFFFSSPS